MTRVRIRLLAIVSASLLMTIAPSAGTTAAAQTIDVFAVSYGDTVADGVPGPGAGNLEAGGAEDRYEFDADSGDVAVLDVLAGSTSTFRWRLDAPDGSGLFDSAYTDRSVEIPQTGTYALTVYGTSGTAVGTYSFRLLLSPPAQEFTIAFGATVSDGVPDPGAGNLEEPGAADRYRFDAAAGQVAILDALSASTNVVRWALYAPDGSEVFDTLYVDRQVALPDAGTYALVVSGLSVTSVGTYSFRLLGAPEAQEFAIGFGATVSDGVPDPGAGNLEEPGAVDRYRFDAAAGQVAILDALSASTNVVRWALSAPDGSVVFDSLFVDRQVTLLQDGTHTLTVSGLNVASAGTYSFRLLEVPPQVDEFTIAFGDTVSDGVPGPGAGNLEGPGAVDRYRFDASTNQVAVLDALSGSTLEVRWALHAPDGSEVFDSFYVDQQVTLLQDGSYTLTVSGLSVTSFGTYSFELREAPANAAPVAADDEAETEHETAVTVDVLANDTDPDGDDLLVDAVSQPADGTATIDVNGVTYTPDPGFAGIDSFTYTAVDGRGGADQATVTVTVLEPANSPPTVSGIDDLESTVGDDVALQVQADDPDGDDLAYATDGLPPGLQIDADTGEIAGTIEDGAASASPYSVEVTVADPGGAEATTAFAWIVHPAPAEPISVDVDVVVPCIVNDGIGVIPVVVYGNDEVAGSEIDVPTVRLEGMPVQRLFGHFLAIVLDLNHDGIDDLFVLIDDVRGAIPDGAASATLTALTSDGRAIEGADRICLLHR